MNIHSPSSFIGTHLEKCPFMLISTVHQILVCLLFFLLGVSWKSMLRKDRDFHAVKNNTLVCTLFLWASYSVCNVWRAALVLPSCRSCCFVLIFPFWGPSLHTCTRGLRLFALLGIPACSGLLQFVNDGAWWLQTYWPRSKVFSTCLCFLSQKKRSFNLRWMRLLNLTWRKHVSRSRRCLVLRWFICLDVCRKSVL